MAECIKSLYDDSIAEDPYRRYEYFKGKAVAPANPVFIKPPTDCAIPVKVEPESSLHVTQGDKTYDIFFSGEKSMNARYFRVNGGTDILFSSNSKMFIGEPISLVQENPHKHKLVLFLFFDSLAQTVLEEDGFENLMPYTSAFFSDALYMQECYCCSDWTLPACATVFTGKYPCEHQLVHPLGGKLQYDTFVKLFKNAGYLTSYFNSNWRLLPEYGYIDDFDRGIYCHGQYRGKCFGLIENMMDHLYAFPNRDHFVTLSVFDLHEHFLANLPHEIGLQINESVEEHAFYRNGRKKGAEKRYTPTLASIYTKQLKLLDYKLQILYNFVSQRYKPDEYVILFCPDHGESYLSPPDFHLHYHSRNKNGDSNDSATDDKKKTYKTLPWEKVMLYMYRKTLPLRLSLKRYGFGSQFAKGRTWNLFRKKIEKMLRKEQIRDNIANILFGEWPHFQTSMQKTPLIIKMSSVAGEHCGDLTDLRSVYNIFAALLSQGGDLNNAMIKEICKRAYVYNESIYPGQTYKAKIIDDKYVLWFETNELVSMNCTLDDLSGYTALFSRETNKEILDEENVVGKYTPIIKEHLSYLRSEKAKSSMS